MHGNLSDNKLIEKTLNNAEYVYYFAGIADIEESKKNPYKTIEDNILGLNNVLNEISKVKINRFVYASTMYVYSSYGSFYRASKQCAEIIVKTYCEEFNFDAVAATWNYNPVFSQKDALIASLFVGGKSLNEVCPDFLRHRWDSINARLNAFYKSFSTAKISMDIHCFFDLVPQRFLLEYCEVKNKITDHIVNTCAKPANYEFLRNLAELTYDISQRKLNLDYSEIARDSHQLKVRNFINIT